MKRIKILILLVFAILLIGAFNMKALAIDGEYSYYEDKEIKKICTYIADKDFGKNERDEKYLYIYSDGTASVGWNAGGCKRTNSKGHCADGYLDKYPGVMNWSTVNTEEHSNGAYDAYSEYNKTGECPGYLAQAEYGSDNRFYLSKKPTATYLKNIKDAAAKAPGSTKYYYYNIDDALISDKIEKDLSCEYKDSKDDKAKTTMTITKDGNISVVEQGEEKQYYFYISQKLFSKMYISLLEANKCPKSVTACMATYNPHGVNEYKYHIYGDSSVATIFCDQYKSWNMDKIEERTLVCEGDNCSDKDICQVYSDYQDQLYDDLNGYPSKSAFKNKEMIDNYNIHKSEFNAYCKSVLSTLDYAEGNCIDACINLSKDLSALEIQKGLQNPYDDKSKCNVGTAIVSMVYNVLKWLKYIAPALVIIFTMLDFIKAIASQNDDDMKKAQGKFVKRLIVAALLFLLPLIINFVLQTFGLFDSSCDVTNLL